MLRSTVTRAFASTIAATATVFALGPLLAAAPPETRPTTQPATQPSGGMMGGGPGRQGMGMGMGAQGQGQQSQPQMDKMDRMAESMTAMADMCRTMMQREMVILRYLVIGACVVGAFLLIALVLFIVLEVQWIRYFGVRIKVERARLAVGPGSSAERR